jgi:creatinine amidohydrolase
MDKMAGTLRYAEMLPHELAAVLASRPVVYLPLGTLEYHGPHLALGNDGLKAEGLCERGCARTGGALAPTLYWGIGGGHKDYRACGWHYISWCRIAYCFENPILRMQ